MSKKLTAVEFDLSREEMEAVEEFRAALDLSSRSSAMRLLIRIGLFECHDPMTGDEAEDTKPH